MNSNIHRIGGQACEALAEAARCLVHGASVASAAVTAAGIVEGSGGVLLVMLKVVLPSRHGAGWGLSLQGMQPVYSQHAVLLSK